MGDNDVQAIKDGLGKVEVAVEKLSDAVADLRVLVAGNYVPKEDYKEHLEMEEARVVALHKRIDGVDDKIDDHQKEEWQDRLKIAGMVVAASASVFSVIQWVVNLAKGGGSQG